MVPPSFPFFLPSFIPSCLPACLPLPWQKGNEVFFSETEFPSGFKKGLERIQSMCNSVMDVLARKDADETASDS